MDNGNSAKMTDVEFEKLEQQVDDLLSACNKLMDENKSLRQQQVTLADERAQLIKKNELARTRVEAMITRLKSMESHQ